MASFSLNVVNCHCRNKASKNSSCKQDLIDWALREKKKGAKRKRMSCSLIQVPCPFWKERKREHKLLHFCDCTKIAACVYILTFHYKAAGCVAGSTDLGCDEYLLGGLCYSAPNIQHTNIILLISVPASEAKTCDTGDFTVPLK